MAWNDSGNGKDPWDKDGEQPNDLDKIMQGWQRKLSGIIGGGSASPGSSGSYVIMVLLVVAWLGTGLYRVDEAERGVVQRFGGYTKTTMPGLHWHYPYPFEVVDIVNVNAVDNFQYQTEMLTADRQYVFIQMVVQYRRTNPYDYSFKVVDPESTLQDVTESGLREVVGTSTLIRLVTEQRDQIAPRTQDIVQSTLDNYGAGIEITSISIEDLDYPGAVQEAVDDAQQAENDAGRYVLEADTYEKDIIPRARGTAAKVRLDAEAYRKKKARPGLSGMPRVTANRFEALLTEYQKAPEVTRDRLYIEAIEEVYGRSNKVFIDSESSGNLLYLPIDQLMRQANRATPGAESNRAADAQTPEVVAQPEREPDDPATKNNEGPTMSNARFGVMVAVGFIVLAIGMSAFTVNEREMAIKLQVGRVVEADYSPGLHWKIPGFQTVVKISASEF